jgi:hypothetical protein
MIPTLTQYYKSIKELYPCFGLARANISYKFFCKTVKRANIDTALHCRCKISDP